ncbi:hypothetical protein KGP25_26355 (plasmid) [Enterobacter sp. JBIWA003]|uniref:conjugal transfer protein TraP n=1 Tax=Enterobacter sp. JBIWA003 TaxID=2831890 RepID=UPI001CC0DD6F|nr:conjugal transfer protein TraP [Enterobacter sp. JBIWA003]UAN24951.1 hypothetical protein KGP25_26355 [Enterobacter sp. JBIWA003]
MINKAMALIVYCIRWVAWVFQYLIIVPLATMVLVVVLLLFLDKKTPGMMVVNYLEKAESITDGQRWTWRECMRQLPKIPQPPYVFTDPAEIADSPGIKKYDCQEVVSDARGYAEYVDRQLLNTLISVWVMTMVTFGLIALLVGIKPKFPCHIFNKKET